MMEPVCISITVRLWLLYSIADEDLLISLASRADCFISHTHIQAPRMLDATQDSLNPSSYAHDRQPCSALSAGMHAFVSVFFLISFHH